MSTIDEPLVRVENGEGIGDEADLAASLAAEIRDANTRYGGILEIRPTDDGRGYGLYALRPFRRGQLVMSSRAVDLPCQGSHSIQVDRNRHVRMDLPARLINHVCNVANVGIRATRQHSQSHPAAAATATTTTTPSYDFYAVRDIQAGEELLWDYECSEYEISNFRCQCGMPGCRGELRGYKFHGPEVLKAYGERYVAAYLLEGEAIEPRR